jgi:hypothetical protein
LLTLFGIALALSSCGGGGSTCPAYSQEYKFDKANEINLAIEEAKINTENES